VAACTQLLIAGVAFIGPSQPLSLLSNKAHWPTFWHKGNWQNNLNPTHAVSRTVDAAAWMHFHKRLHSGWDQRDTDRYMFYESINKLRTHTHTFGEIMPRSCQCGHENWIYTRSLQEEGALLKRMVRIISLKGLFDFLVVWIDVFACVFCCRWAKHLRIRISYRWRKNNLSGRRPVKPLTAGEVGSHSRRHSSFFFCVWSSCVCQARQSSADKDKSKGLMQWPVLNLDHKFRHIRCQIWDGCGCN